jgi:hypothetical protein
MALLDWDWLYIVFARELILGAQGKGVSRFGSVECLASLVVALLENLKKR